MKMDIMIKVEGPKLFEALKLMDQKWTLHYKQFNNNNNFVTNNMITMS